MYVLQPSSSTHRTWFSGQHFVKILYDCMILRNENPNYTSTTNDRPWTGVETTSVDFSPKLSSDRRTHFETFLLRPSISTSNTSISSAASAAPNSLFLSTLAVFRCRIIGYIQNMRKPSVLVDFLKYVFTALLHIYGPYIHSLQQFIMCRVFSSKIYLLPTYVGFVVLAVVYCD